MCISHAIEHDMHYNFESSSTAAPGAAAGVRLHAHVFRTGHPATRKCYICMLMIHVHE